MSIFDRIFAQYNDENQLHLCYFAQNTKNICTFAA
jgi:hypothetical protein